MLYILYGDDESRIEYHLEQIKQKEQCDQIERWNACRDPKEVIENALETGSLFAMKPMVIIEQATFLGAKNDSGLDAARIEARIADDRVIVLLAPVRKLDSRKKAVKSMISKARMIECTALDEKSQPEEIRRMLKEKKLTMNPDAFQWFCDHAGFSCAVLSGQLDKLALFSDHLHLEDVQALTTLEPSKNVFQMTDALFGRDRIRLLELYRSFRKQNMEPQAILGLLAGQIRFVYQVRVLMDEGYSKENMMETLQASSGRIWNTSRQAARFSADQLLENLALLSELDESIKRGSAERDTAFENFILQIPVHS